MYFTRTTKITLLLSCFIHQIIFANLKPNIECAGPMAEQLEKIDSEYFFQSSQICIFKQYFNSPNEHRETLTKLVHFFDNCKRPKHSGEQLPKKICESYHKSHGNIRILSNVSYSQELDTHTLTLKSTKFEATGMAKYTTSESKFVTFKPISSDNTSQMIFTRQISVQKPPLIPESIFIHSALKGIKSDSNQTTHEIAYYLQKDLNDSAK